MSDNEVAVGDPQVASETPASAKKKPEKKLEPEFLALNKTRTKLKIFDDFVLNKDLPKYTVSAPEAKEFNSENFTFAKKAEVSSGARFPQTFKVYRGRQQLDFSKIDERMKGFLREQGGKKVAERAVAGEFDMKQFYYDRSYHYQNFNEEEGEGQDEWTYGDLRRAYDAEMADMKSRLLLEQRTSKRKKSADKVLTLKEFFVSAKNSLEETKLMSDRADKYEQLILNAKATGQTALFESLKDGALLMRAEAQLSLRGVNKYLREETVVDFLLNTELGHHVRLDWLKGFGRPIPEDVIKKKENADSVYFFDNYVVMHMDPTGRGPEESHHEHEQKVAAAKEAEDPILFGVLKGKRILYYIGDWVDPLCDLTLEKVVETMLAAGKTVGDVVRRTEDMGFVKDDLPKGRARSRQPRITTGS